MTDPISMPIQSLLTLFANELSDVKFPDADSTVLGESARAVEAAAEAVRLAEAALESARAILAERQEALLQKAQRALAYARVYAETDPALTSRVDAIALPRSPRRGPARDASDALVLSAEPPQRRRGRPSKADACASLLETVSAPADPH
jgi:hypothetical protein